MTSWPASLPAMYCPGSKSPFHHSYLWKGQVLTLPLCSDWYRKQTAQDSFEPVVDVLLNWAIFIYLGAICPWDAFAPSATGTAQTRAPFPLWRLVCLAIAIFALRRLPSVLILYKGTMLRPHVTSMKEALLMGYFGPIGVSALFYMLVGLEYIETHILDDDGQPRSDVRELFYVMEVVVWFIVVSNVVSTPFTLKKRTMN